MVHPIIFDLLQTMISSSAVSQQHSLAPLGILEESMRKVLTYHQVTPDFLTNLFACGEHPQASDAGSGNFTFHPLASGGHGKTYRKTPLTMTVTLTHLLI